MRRFVFIALAAGAALGCRGQTSEEQPIALLRNMHFQQRFNAQSETVFFGDHRTMRPPVAGTVQRDDYIDEESVRLGTDAEGTAYVPTIPEEVLSHFGPHTATDDERRRLMVDRGRERFGIYCTPCHGRVGDGHGIITTRAQQTQNYTFPEVPTFHQDRLRHAPDGQIYATITNGIRNMPSYAGQIPVTDRWAIVSYFRALQLSQGPSNGAAQ